MAKIDPVKERQRLAALYAEMDDFELEKVGADPRELTEWARAALMNEMNNRGLEWKPESQLGKPIPEGEVLVRLRGYTDPDRASVDKTFLQDAGIKAFFHKQEDSGSVAPPSSEPKEIVLLVQAKDLMAAQEALAEKDEGERASSEAGVEAPPHPPSKPVVLRQYRDITEAMIDKTALDSAGIACFLYDDNMVRLDWLISNAIGGVKLVVAENDAEEAARILAGAVQEDSAGPTQG